MRHGVNSCITESTECRLPPESLLRHLATLPPSAIQLDALMDKNNYLPFVCDCGYLLDRSESVSPPPSCPVASDDPASTNVDPFPNWFLEFLNDRQTRKPSAHTMKAYRQDYIAIATLVANAGQNAERELVREDRTRSRTQAHIRRVTTGSQ